MILVNGIKSEIMIGQVALAFAMGSCYISHSYIVKLQS